jgi:hypothetical protein
MYEQPKQVAVTPDVTKVQLEPTLGRLDDNFVISGNVEHSEVFSWQFSVSSDLLTVSRILVF